MVFRTDIFESIRWVPQGVSADKILDDIHQSMPQSLQRHHILAKKDIHNIQQAYGLKNVQRHANDQQSVLAWIEEWRSNPETNPVLFHKMQGEQIDDYPLQEDFMIVVQSPIQKKPCSRNLAVKGSVLTPPMVLQATTFILQL